MLPMTETDITTQLYNMHFIVYSVEHKAHLNDLLSIILHGMCQ